MEKCTGCCNIISSTICSVAVTLCSAQVYIADPIARTMLNNLIPGVVDATGVMDTLHSGIALVDSADFDLGDDTASIELQGLEFLDSLRYLNVSFDGFNGTSSEFLLFPGLPPSLIEMTVFSLSGTIEIAQIPSGVQYFEAIGGPATTSLNVLDMPDTIPEVDFHRIVDINWNVPVHVDQLLLHWYDLTVDTVVLPQADVDMLMVMSGSVTVLDMSAVLADALWIDELDFLDQVVWPTGLVQLELNIDELPLGMTWPLGLENLQADLLLPSCVPWLPESLISLMLTHPGIECLPNWPPNLPNCIIGSDWFTENTVSFCSILNSDCPGSNPGISGQVLIDADQNGQGDPGEPPLQQASVTLLPNGNVSGCDPNGYWEIGVLPGSYTITPSVSYPYIQSISPNTHTANLPNMGDADTLNDFAVTLIPDIEDLRAHCHAEPARPGFNNRLYLTCQNYGTVPMDAQLALEYDADQTWVGSSTAPTTQSGTIVSWQLGTLAIGASQLITVDLNTATTVPLGTPIDQTLSASPVAGDETPQDNVVVITDSVVGSYDPNDKLLTPVAMSPEQVMSGTKPITYTIRFQNTGTFLAERVVIVDTLPEGLQPQSVEFLSSSHSCHWYVLDGVLHFIHEGINLPDSTSDEPASHGYVQFRILPDTDLVDGETVTNIAHIVFDFNTPIITPPAVFSVDIEAGIAVASEFGAITVYPNPVRDHLRMDLGGSVPGPLAFVIEDPVGRMLRTGKTTDQSLLDVSDLPDGAYVLHVRSDDHMATVRFVKR